MSNSRRNTGSKSIRFNDKDYHLHVVHSENIQLYEPILKKLRVCDTSVISKSNEKLSYDALSEEGYYGFFISNTMNTVIYNSAIVDINCSQIGDKLIDNDIDIDIMRSVELVLLCSNSSNRVKGLTAFLLNFIIDNVILVLKPTCQNVLLYVAKGETNTSAGDFYKKIGFEFLKGNFMAYMYKKNTRPTTKRTRSKMIMNSRNKSRHKTRTQPRTQRRSKSRSKSRTKLITKYRSLP